MPRTGNPRGRPKASGQIGEDQVRLTVRLPRMLYLRLLAYAHGRNVATCAREVLEAHLTFPKPGSQEQAKTTAKKERRSA